MENIRRSIDCSVCGVFLSTSSSVRTKCYKHEPKCTRKFKLIMAKTGGITKGGESLPDIINSKVLESKGIIA